MKKVLVFLFSSLFVMSCTNDSESDLQEETSTTVEAKFTSDILPMIESKCKPCHVSGGSNTNYSSVANSKGAIVEIVNRINREASEQGFMPQGGTKLSTVELGKFDDWLNLINAE